MSKIMIQSLTLVITFCMACTSYAQNIGDFYHDHNQNIVEVVDYSRNGKSILYLEDDAHKWMKVSKFNLKFELVQESNLKNTNFIKGEKSQSIERENDNSFEILDIQNEINRLTEQVGNSTNVKWISFALGVGTAGVATILVSGGVSSGGVVVVAILVASGVTHVVSSIVRDYKMKKIVRLQNKLNRLVDQELQNK